MKVLIVDDEPEVRETLREAFEDEGDTVRTAGDGAEALRVLAQADGVDVMVLDLIMPVMSGGDLYRALQADPRLTGTPVVITTSDPARAPSGVLVMRKPLDLDRLIDTVHALAGRRTDG